MDLTQLSTEDLQALKSQDLSKVSTAGLMQLRGTLGGAPIPVGPEQAPPAMRPATPEPQGPVSFMDRVTAIQEAALDLVAKTTGGTVGMLLGAAQQNPRSPDHEAIQRSAEAGTNFARQALSATPLGLVNRLYGGGTGEKMSPLGQQYSENVERLGEELKVPPIGPHLATPAPIARALPGLKAGATEGPGYLAGRVREVAGGRRVDPTAFPDLPPVEGKDGTFLTPGGNEITREDWANAGPNRRKVWMTPAEKPEAVPVGEATEISTAEANRLVEAPARPVLETDSPEVQKVVDSVVKKREAQSAKKQQAAKLREAALQAGTDPEVQAALRKRADALDPPPKIPVGKTTEGAPEVKTEPVKKLPVGEATEITPERVELGDEPIPIGEATEITPQRVEVGDAPDQVRQQEGVLGERAQGDEGRPPAEAGGGDRVLGAAPGEGAQGGEEVGGQTLLDTAGKSDDLEFPKIDETRITRMGEVMARQNYEPAKVPVVQATRKLKGLVEQLDKGKIDAERFEIGVRGLAARMIRAAETKSANALFRDRERGVDIVRERLIAARRRGEYDSDGVDLALWVLDKNPNIATNLGISVTKAPEGVKALGDYNPAMEIVRIFKDQNANTQTATHEILHHSERLMPEAVRKGIRKEWERAYAKALAKTEPGSVQRQVMQDFLGMMAGDAKARGRVLDAFRGGILDKGTHYQLTNPSEFWAVNGARIMHERFTGRGSWRAQARQWLREMVEKVKDLVGLRSDAAVLRALRDVLDPKVVTGEKTAKSMLSDVKANGEFRDVKGAQTDTPKSMPAETAMQGRLKNWLDDLLPVERAQKVVAPATESADVRLAAKLRFGRAQQRGDELERTFIKPLAAELKAAKKQGLTVQDADDYLMALHADERNRVIAARNPKMPDGGSGLTNAQAKAIIDGFTPEQRSALDRVAKIVHDMNNAKLDAMVTDGVITTETRENLRRQYKSYVPLKTLDEEDSLIGVGRGFRMRPNDIQMALGRQSKAGSPIAATIMDSTRAILRGEKARVDKSIWEYANQGDTTNIIRPYEELKRKADGVWVDTEGNAKRPPQSLIKRDVNKQTGKVEEYLDRAEVDKQTMELVVDGEAKRVFVPDPALMTALKGVSEAGIEPDKFLKAIGDGTRAFSRTLTEWNVAFAPVNIVRDTITAAIRGKRLGVEGVKVLAGIPRAMKDIAASKVGKRVADYDEFAKVGGRIGAYGLTDVSDVMDRLAKAGADLGYADQQGAGKAAKRKFMKGLGAVGHVISAYNEVFEYSVRLSAYREARAAGMTPKRAATVARDTTLDFNVKGEVGRRYGRLYPFFNAALQGIANDTKDVIDKRTRMRMLSLVAIGGMVEVLNDVYSDVLESTGEKEADAQYDSTLDTNIVLAGADTKIPLPPGVAAGLYTLGRRAARIVNGGDMEKESVGILSALTSAFLPIRLGDTGEGVVTNVVQGAIPALVRPFTDVAANRDNFGNPIVPERIGDKSPAPHYTLSRKSTSQIAKDVSKFLNDVTGGDDVKPGRSQKYLGNFVAPEAMEYIIGYYTGGVGQLALQSKNIIKNAAEDKPTPVEKIPIAKRFVMTEPQSYVSRRYKELAKEFDYVRDYEKAGTPDKADPKARRAYGDYLIVEKELPLLFRQLRGSEGAERERIEAQIKQLQARVVKAYNGQQTQ